MLHVRCEPVFAVRLKLTVPFPLPLELVVNQLQFELAVQEQPLPALTENDPLLAEEVKFWEDGLME
jgi:hypothetical protein